MLFLAPILASESVSLLVFGMAMRLASGRLRGVLCRHNLAHMSAAPMHEALSLRHLPLMPTARLEGGPQ